AKGQSAALFLQDRDGKFVKSHQPAFEEDRDSEDIDAIFFDADNDGDQDIYVVSGGYEYEIDDRLLQDRLYLNDGNGAFTRTVLPEMFISGSCVRPSDVDQDGDLDLFVGGRIIPGRYPETPRSLLLVNNGNAGFTIGSVPQELKNAGMITDALWGDLNEDKYEDLIVVGEWMGVEVFINEGGALQKRTSDYIHEPTMGWWNCIVAGDFDNDGDMDFVVGNFGLNNQIKASPERPAAMWFSDFDHNGSVDPILTYYIMGENFPYPTRDELVQQLPGFKKRFNDYASYSAAGLDKLLTTDEQGKASVLHAVQMQSCYIRNEGN